MGIKKENFFTKFLGEFKEFISRGNVLDMAVGVVVGGAFTAIIKSLVDDVIMPIVGAILVGVNFKALGFTIPWGKNPYVNIGGFITAIITFLLTAMCVFIIVKAVNVLRNFGKKKEEEVEKVPEITADVALLTEIRDLLIAQKNANASSETISDE